MIYLRSWFIGHSAGQYTHMQLWNRGSEPIRVEAVVLSATKDSSACLLHSSAPLPHGIVKAGAGADEGLRSDGALSTHGELRFVVDPEYEGGQLLTVKIKADESKSIPEMADWEIPPGRGLLVRMGCMDVGLYGSFKWHESA